MAMAGITSSEEQSYWNRLLTQWQMDVKVWMLCVGILEAIRVFSILFFREKIADTSGFHDIALVLFNGMRFDMRIGAYCVIPTVLLSLLGKFGLANRLRRLLAFSFLCCSLVVGTVDVGFFREYNDQFNHWMFGVIYDDLGAILKTVWKTYPIPSIVAAVAVCAAAGILGLGRWLNGPFIPSHRTSLVERSLALKVLVLFLTVSFLIFSVRGSIGRRPMQLKDAAVSDDDFLNKMILNPYYALYYAAKEHRELLGAKGLQTFLPDGNIDSALKLLFPQDRQPRQNIDEYFRRTASGREGTKPQHIFLIVMESQDSWPLLPQYQSLGICPELSALARKGVWVGPFLPSGQGTMSALASLITGLPDVGAMTNYRPAARSPLPFSITRQFKELGYRTHFFYGGFLSWQRVGDFCKEQQFDEVYGGGHMDASIANEWGAMDEQLYDFVLSRINPAEKSFNLILTTSNHPPYSVDFKARGFPLESIPPEIAGGSDKHGDLFKSLGHMWYGDHCVGDFIRRAADRFAPALFAVTGDHQSRRFPGSRPTLFEESSVPFILYGPEVLKGTRIPGHTAGSHIDIAPTLIELTAQAGFQYYSFGSDMLGPGGKEMAFGRNCIITPWAIIKPSMGEGNPELLPFFPSVTPGCLQGDLEALHRAYLGIGWWRLMKGSSRS